MVASILLQGCGMGQHFREILICDIALPPPCTDKSSDTCLRRPVHLTLNGSIVGGIIANGGQVRRGVFVPARRYIPGVVESQHRAFDVDSRRGRQLYRIQSNRSMSRPTSVYSIETHAWEQHN